jgi:hypothetical protein
MSSGIKMKCVLPGCMYNSVDSVKVSLCIVSLHASSSQVDDGIKFPTS